MDLNRTISLPLLVSYGLGTILGAGVYVLTGVVAGEAGLFTPLSFLLAALVAAPTAFSFAELGGRFPFAAGEAMYVDKAFGRHVLTGLTGLSVALVGLVSAATIARGFVGYLDIFIVLPDALVVTVVVLVLGALAAWGVLQSVIAATLVTLVEVGGLVLVNVIGLPPAIASPVEMVWVPGVDAAKWAGVFAGAFLAFYAFIGFEDIVNMAEETKDPSRNVPFAVIASLGISTALYFVTAFVAVYSVPLETIADNPAPMAVVVERNSDLPAGSIAVISMLAVVNGALVQIIMASRVLYGMAKLGRLPAYLGQVQETTRTPLRSTLLVVSIVLTLALAFDVEALAGFTSSLTLLIFATINVALIVIKRRGLPTEGPVCPAFIPWLGTVASIALFSARFL